MFARRATIRLPGHLPAEERYRPDARNRWEEPMEETRRQRKPDQERQGRTGAEGGADRLQPRTRRPGPAAPPVHTACQARRQGRTPCAGERLDFRGPDRGGRLMRSAPRMTVVSLGGGVQSSVMALMAGGGAFGRVPDCAIFADTGWEPPTIYEHLEWLADKLRFPVHVVDNGRSLREDARALVNHSGNESFIDIPVYLKGTDGSGDGMGRRQCTEHYKVRRAPRSAWVERSRCGTRPGVGRWLGKQARGPEAKPCLKPSRQCGGGDPAKPCAASQSVVMVTKGTAD